jgi:hypothetical protein
MLPSGSMLGIRNALENKSLPRPSGSLVPDRDVASILIDTFCQPNAKNGILRAWIIR